MNDKQLLRAAGMSRRQASANQRALDAASLVSTGITAHAARRMKRIMWEADRPASRLGRVGERASQFNAAVIPTAAAAAALFSAVGAGLELWERIERFRNRHNTEGEGTSNG